MDSIPQIERDINTIYEERENKGVQFRPPWNPLNVLFHSHLSKLMEAGLKRPFDFDMLYDVESYFSTATYIKDINTVIGRQDIRKNLSFYSIVKKISSLRHFIGITLLTIVFSVQVAIPYIVRLFLDWQTDLSQSKETGWALGGTLVLLALSRPVLFLSGYFYIYTSMIRTESGTRVSSCLR